MSSEVRVDGRLYRDWWTVAGLFGLVAVAGSFGAAMAAGMASAVRWGVLAAVIGAVELVYVRRLLPHNHPADRPLQRYARLGLANLVTLTRGGLFAALAGFAALEPTPALAWLPALCYGTGVTLDLVDGLVARRVDRPTVLGEKLDLAFDTLGFLVAPVVGVLWGRLPVWYLSLAVARYAFKFGCWQRERRGLPLASLPPSSVRRYLAAIQMAFLTLALAPVLPFETVRLLAVVVLAPSLIGFLRDYLAVTGRR